MDTVLKRLQDAVAKSSDESAECMIDGLELEYDEVEDEGWDDDGKYSFNYVIYKIEGKYYGFCQTRSGSYFTDYYYSVDEVQELPKKEDETIFTITSNSVDVEDVISALNDCDFEYKKTFVKGWD
jgi:hypothetical protein